MRLTPAMNRTALRVEHRVAPQLAGDGLIPQVVHIVVCVLTLYLFAFSLIFGVGFFWMAFMLKRTGRRARDMLAMPLPLFGLFTVTWPTLWRATSRDMYWSTRPEYRSEPNAAWQSPLRWFKEIGKPEVATHQHAATGSTPVGAMPARDETGGWGSAPTSPNTPTVATAAPRLVTGKATVIDAAAVAGVETVHEGFAEADTAADLLPRASRIPKHRPGG